MGDTVSDVTDHHGSVWTLQPPLVAAWYDVDEVWRCDDHPDAQIDRYASPSGHTWVVVVDGDEVDAAPGTVPLADVVELLWSEPDDDSDDWEYHADAAAEAAMYRARDLEHGITLPDGGKQ